jgi:hypothetical protein
MATGIATAYQLPLELHSLKLGSQKPSKNVTKILKQDLEITLL